MIERRALLLVESYVQHVCRPARDEANGRLDANGDAVSLTTRGLYLSTEAIPLQGTAQVLFSFSASIDMLRVCDDCRESSHVLDFPELATDVAGLSQFSSVARLAFGRRKLLSRS
jgi:hypothetical protein